MTFQISRGNHRADAGVKHRTLKLLFSIYISLRLPWWLSGKEYACNAGDPDSIPGSGRENGDPLQYSCLENSMHRGAWHSTVHRAAESHMTEAIKQQQAAAYISFTIWLTIEFFQKLFFKETACVLIQEERWGQMGNGE